jgi:hypothetical protein
METQAHEASPGVGKVTAGAFRVRLESLLAKIPRRETWDGFNLLATRETELADLQAKPPNRPRSEAPEEATRAL